MPRYWNPSFLFFIAVLMPGTCLAGETVYAKRPYTRLLAAPDLSSETILKLDRGTRLLVTKKQDRWLKVVSGNKAGWVYMLSVSSKAPEKQKLRPPMEPHKESVKPRREPSSIPTTAVIRGLDEPEKAEAEEKEEVKPQE